MCVVIAKYFKDIGWCGVKNRDRNYVPKISFERYSKNEIDMLVMYDDMTGYCEGMNDKGISILSASLMTLDDETEITLRTKSSRDGIAIKKALFSKTVKEAVDSLIESKMTGNTIIFDKNNCYILEAAWKNHEYGNYDYKTQKLKNDEVAVRTNTGVFLPLAGYQKTGPKSEQLSAISSEARMAIGKRVANKAEEPLHLLDGLCKQYSDNPQMNALRTSWRGKKMRTTSQMLIIPDEKTMFFRPIQSDIKYDFWKSNGPDDKLWVEILSNRVLWNSGLKHSTNHKHEGI